MINDCYARYDEGSARFVIGNDCIEKAIQINGALLRTEKITDRKNGTTWEGGPPLWQRCPVFEEGEQPDMRFETAVTDNPIGMLPHLKAIIEFAGKGGTAWYEYIVFPGIPFVFSQIFIEPKTTVHADGVAEETAACTGIEHEYSQNTGGEVICSPDTLDCIPLGNRHLELETFTLYDKTDRNDSLLERQTVPIYKNGRQEREGNIFRISDYPRGDSLLLVKHSPTPSSALNRQSKDILVNGNTYASLLGTGVDFSAMPTGRVPCYASAVGAAKTTDILGEFWRYSNAFSCGDPGRSLFVMSNTWGDRSSDTKISEAFILQEIERAHEIGVDIVQIDDGWESGITANSRRKAGGVWEGYYSDNSDFWQVNPERFPNGLEPVVERAREYGMEIGLWFSPDSSNDFKNVEKDIETLWGLHRRYGVRYFKLDGVKIRSKRSEMRFIHLLQKLTEMSGGEIRFNMDVTAEDRFGYLYQTTYGTLFVENRYTDWANYYPHATFRNLWNLASVIPARRLQMELLNNRRNPDKYAGMPFAPAEYRIDYLFASVMSANPLVWMELSGLREEDAALLSDIVSVYKRYAAELFEAQVIPIGCEPNGMRFSGYLCRNADGKTGHLLLFRERTEDAEYSFALPLALKDDHISILYQDAPVTVSCREREVTVGFSHPRSFVWLRYDTK